MTPDSAKYNPDPKYLRALIKRTGFSLRDVSKLLGLSWNGFYNYLRDESDPIYRPATYTVQFALECLAHNSAIKSELSGE